MGVHAFGDFSDGTVASTLYLGCEPRLKAALGTTRNPLGHG